MSETIFVCLDRDAHRALAELEATGMSRSDAVRHGLAVALDGARRAHLDGRSTGTVPARG